MSSNGASLILQPSQTTMLNSSTCINVTVDLFKPNLAARRPIVFAVAVVSVSSLSARSFDTTRVGRLFGGLSPLVKSVVGWKISRLSKMLKRVPGVFAAQRSERSKWWMMASLGMLAQIRCSATCLTISGSVR
jgi:hypothetical protein